MSFKLDLKKFHVISKDKKSTTLQHVSGHKMILAHDRLNPENRAMLDALPEHNAPNQKLAESKKASTKMADGGEVADSGGNPDTKPVTININNTHPPIPQDLQSPLPTPKLPPNPGESALPYGIDPESYAKMQEANAPAPQEQPATTSALQQGADTPAAESPASPLAQTDSTPDIAAGYQQQKAGIAQAGEAQAAQGQAEAQALKQSVGIQQAMQAQYQKTVNDLNQERQNFIYDYQNQHIDPNHYLKSMGVGQKITTAIGLILGGFGAGAGQSNAAQDFLNGQISRDIDAQKAELGKSENLLSANLRQFGNMHDATQMTQIMQTDIVANKLKMAAATAATPLAKANALMEAGKLEQSVAPQWLQFTMRRAAMQAGSNGQPGNPDAMLNYLRWSDPEKAKELESRYVPGVGVASVPISSETRQNIVAKQTLQQRAQDMYSWAQAHSGSLNPAEVNVGKTKAAELQSLYRNAINGGVFKKGEQEFIDNIVDSDPTKFFNSIRVLPKLKEVINSNHMQLNTLKDSVGLPSTTQGQEIEAKLPAQQKQYLDWARKNPNDPKAQMVFKKLGLQ